jgi:hypothetical protein
LNPTLIKAVGVVTFALLFYSIGIIKQQRKTSISKSILFFLTVGVICDISSTALMIAGSRNIPITVHGFIGYSALLVMLIDTILIWRLWRKNKVANSNLVIAEVPRNLHLYTRFAYIWWVIAYIAGGVISLTLGG